MSRYVVYYRVSTQRQGVSGLGLEAQRHSVENFLKSGDIVLSEFIEIESGSRYNRPELDKAIEEAVFENAILLIAKLDRLARSVKFMANLEDKHVKFIACDCPEANDTMIQFMSVMAEWELKQIRERTRAALERSRLRGTKFGTPENLRTTYEDRLKGARAMTAKADKFAMHMGRIIEKIMNNVGVVSYSGIARHLNTRKFESARAKKWTGVTVKNVITRYKKLKYGIDISDLDEQEGNPNEDLRSTRIRQGLREAKLRGVKLGNPGTLIATDSSQRKAAQAIKKKADSFSLKMMPVICEIVDGGTTCYRDIADELTEQGYRTARGKSWTPTSVKNIIDRYKSINPAECTAIDALFEKKSSTRKDKSRDRPSNLRTTAEDRKKGTLSLQRAADRFALDMYPIIDMIIRTDVVSYAAIARELNERGLKTSRGKQWKGPTVKAVILRYQAINPISETYLGPTQRGDRPETERYSSDSLIDFPSSRNSQSSVGDETHTSDVVQSRMIDLSESSTMPDLPPVLCPTTGKEQQPNKLLIDGWD